MAAVVSTFLKSCFGPVFLIHCGFYFDTSMFRSNSNFLKAISYVMLNLVSNFCDEVRFTLISLIYFNHTRETASSEMFCYDILPVPAHLKDIPATPIVSL